MTPTTEINSAFYALRMLSHGIKTSEVEILAGNEYPGSEFTEEEQRSALSIIRAIEEEELSAVEELAPERRQFHLNNLADQIERISNTELDDAAYRHVSGSTNAEHEVTLTRPQEQLLNPIELYDQAILLEEILQRLDPWTRKVFELRVDGHNFDQIATIIGIKSNVLRARWRENVRRLAERIRSETKAAS